MTPDDKYEDALENVTDDMMNRIRQQIEHQFNKYPHQRINSIGWIAIIAEEFGEMVQACLQLNQQEFVKEAAQVMACIIRMVHEVEREFNGEAEKEAERYTRPV